jgi:hypothetical protein
MSGDHFIPFRKRDIIRMCLEEGRLDEAQQQSFSEFCSLTEALLHLENHTRLEELKEAYRPFSPDTDTVVINPPTAEEKKDCQKRLVAGMEDILERANFSKVTLDDIKRSLEDQTSVSLLLEVDLDDFEEVVLFRRRQVKKKMQVADLWGFRKKEAEISVYDRVALYVKFKDEEYFRQKLDPKGKGKKLKKFGDLPFTPGTTVIKLFQDIPLSDFEMLFPNAQLKLRMVDKLLIGVPALIGGIALVASKLLSTLLLVLAVIAVSLGLMDKAPGELSEKHLIALGVGLGMLGMHFFKQYTKIKNRKLQFLRDLSESLYYRNLDNNMGVLHHLIDAAEEEEFKEAVLAYYFLLTRGEAADVKALDDQIEQWMEQTWKTPMDFEVDDAVQKLDRLGLITRDGEKLKCLCLHDAKVRLDHIWDNHFQYNAELVQAEGPVC